jgi:hypothetical protein
VARNRSCAGRKSKHPKDHAGSSASAIPRARRREAVARIEDEKLKEERCRCHLPTPELAGKSENQQIGFGTDVVFGSIAESRISPDPGG